MSAMIFSVTVRREDASGVFGRRSQFSKRAFGHGQSLDDSIRPYQQRLRDRQVERLRGLEGDDELELRGIETTASLERLLVPSHESCLQGPTGFCMWEF